MAIKQASIPRRLIGVFRIDPHATMQHQITMKILTQELFPTLAKGVRGI
jgi:hypothetical protein